MKFLFLFVLSLNVFSLDCEDQAMKKLPVLDQGRVKTLLVAARSTLHTLTGKYKHGEQSALEFFCQYNLNSNPPELKIPVEHQDLKVFLKVEDSIPVQNVINRKDEVRVEIMKTKENSSYKKALNKLWFRADTFERLVAGELWTVPVKTSEDFKWHSFKDIYSESTPGENDLLTRAQSYDAANSTNYKLENILVQYHIFSIAMLLSLLAIFMVVLVKNLKVGMLVALASIAIQIYGITLRVLISGRAPITNMYETVLFSGLGALIIAFIIYGFKKDKIFILGGLGYNILCLFMMKFSQGMLDENISPLVPVLRDNFWLSTHVTTIILSYAALALSWMIANIVMFKQRFGSMTKAEFVKNERLIYVSVIVGTILLSTGIILGGVWADYSWGRFWGWDPKETWSLIVLLIYISLLHGRGTNWIKPHTFVVACAAGFMSVMMAWFGVNYILASGLHSYGFSEGGAIFLGSFFLVQILFILITYKDKTKKTPKKKSV